MSYIFTSQLEAIENIKNQLDEAIENTENELKQVHVERNELLIFTKFRNVNTDVFEPVDMEAYEFKLAEFAQTVKALSERLEIQKMSKVRFDEFIQEQYQDCCHNGHEKTFQSTV